MRPATFCCKLPFGAPSTCRDPSTLVPKQAVQVCTSSFTPSEEPWMASASAQTQSKANSDFVWQTYTMHRLHHPHRCSLLTSFDKVQFRITSHCLTCLSWTDCKVHVDRAFQGLSMLLPIGSHALEPQIKKNVKPEQCDQSNVSTSCTTFHCHTSNIPSKRGRSLHPCWCLLSSGCDDRVETDAVGVLLPKFFPDLKDLKAHLRSGACAFLKYQNNQHSVITGQIDITAVVPGILAQRIYESDDKNLTILGISLLAASVAKPHGLCLSKFHIRRAKKREGRSPWTRADGRVPTSSTRTAAFDFMECCSWNRECQPQLVSKKLFNTIRQGANCIQSQASTSLASWVFWIASLGN